VAAGAGSLAVAFAVPPWRRAWHLSSWSWRAAAGCSEPSPFYPPISGPSRFWEVVSTENRAGGQAGGGRRADGQGRERWGRITKNFKGESRVLRKAIAPLALAMLGLPIRALPQATASQAPPEPVKQSSNPGQAALAFPTYALGERLPANFKLSSFDAVFTGKIAPPRGEFEDAEAYVRRLTALAGDEHLFEVKPDDVTYNTETAAFAARFMPDRTYIGGPLEAQDSLRGSFVVSSSMRRAGSYAGQTGLGVKVRVNRITETENALVFRRRIEPDRFISVPVPVNLSEAPAVKRRLQFYVLCRMAPGVVGPARLVRARSAPEYPTNNDQSLIFKYLFVDRLTIIAVDRQTQQILGRLDLVDEANVREKGDSDWEYPEMDGKKQRWK
jgi:hypothetical protein